MTYLKCWKKEIEAVNWEFYIQENHPQQWGEIKIFPDKQKLSDSVTSKPALQQMLKGVPSGWTKRISDSNLKIFDEIKILVKLIYR